jgi:hypothetical protein
VSYFGMGQTDSSLDEAKARVEALKAKLAARQAAPSEPVKTMSSGPAPQLPAPAPQSAPMSAPIVRTAYQPPLPSQPQPQQGGAMKNMLQLLGVGLVAGVAVVILQRAFRKN